MKKKVLFLTTAHQYDDDRIFYHQALELKNNGFLVKICSLWSDCRGNMEGIDVESYSALTAPAKTKIKVFGKVIKNFDPDVVICSEPLAVIAAHKYRQSKKYSIIYDITEWYPSYRMLEKYNSLLKAFHYVKFFGINLYAGFLSTHFIFGEYFKRFPLAFFFPFKKRMMLPYFPDEKFIEKNIQSISSEKITLCVTGRISKEDGIENFFNAVAALRTKKPNLDLHILIIGKLKKERDLLYWEDLKKNFKFKNLVVQKPVSFMKFSEGFAEAHICLDLREPNYEYSRSLPIKVFYYIGSGKPVIYSNLKALKKQIDISEFGYLVNPEDSEKIANAIIEYIENPELYQNHAERARKAFKTKYNWRSIKNSFVNFVENSAQPL